MSDSRAGDSRKSTERFSDRVDDYVRYRPGYPAAALDYMGDRAGLGEGAVVADVGSGTGTLTALLLDRGCRVHAIEPNPPMRAAAERALGDRSGFESHAGTAEATGLEGASVDAVTAAQAFHWFDVDGARREFDRILTPAGRVVLIWNRRLTEASEFLREYEAALLRYGLDYARVDHRTTAGPDVLDRFFGSGAYEAARFPNTQRLDWTGVVGRLSSSSYCPKPDHPDFEPLTARVRRAFDRGQRDGTVQIVYDTEVFVGRPDRSAASGVG